MCGCALVGKLSTATLRGYLNLVSLGAHARGGGGGSGGPREGARCSHSWWKTNEDAACARHGCRPHPRCRRRRRMHAMPLCPPRRHSRTLARAAPLVWSAGRSAPLRCLPLPPFRLRAGFFSATRGHHSAQRTTTLGSLPGQPARRARPLPTACCTQAQDLGPACTSASPRLRRRERAGGSASERNLSGLVRSARRARARPRHMDPCACMHAKACRGGAGSCRRPLRRQAPTLGTHTWVPCCTSVSVVSPRPARGRFCENCRVPKFSRPLPPDGTRRLASGRRQNTCWHREQMCATCGDVLRRGT